MKVDLGEQYHRTLQKISPAEKERVEFLDYLMVAKLLKEAEKSRRMYKNTPVKLIDMGDI